MALAQSNRNKIILGCVIAGAVAVAGCAVYTATKKKDEEEELSFTVSKEAPAAPAQAQASNLDALADELAKELSTEAPAPAAAEAPVVSPAPAGSAASEGYKPFPELGVKIKLPDSWEAAVDDYSMVGPQIAVVRIIPPGFTNPQEEEGAGAPGELPNLSLIVEDVSREHMTLTEYKEKSREFAMNSSGGMMGMIMPPQITKDSEVSIGRFQHTLEYTQVFPNPGAGGMAWVPFKFMNLMALHNGSAYVVQYMARSDKYDEFLEEATQVAQNMIIENLPPRKESHINYTSSPHSLQVTVPETWCVTKENKDVGNGRTMVVNFQTGSTNKPDGVAIYTLNAGSSTPLETAQKYRDAINKTGDITEKDGLAQFTYTADSRVIAVYASATTVMECKPEGERITHHITDPATLCKVLKSVTSTTASKSSIRYTHAEGRFAFDLAPNSKLLEHKWGTTNFTYTPVQLSADAQQSVPIFTVEVNKEEEHYPDLKAVEAKILADSDPSTPLKDKKIETIRGREYLTFIISREEGLQGPFGPREEFRSKIMISLRGDESVMLKWEVAGNEWLRYERHLNAVLESFEVLE